MRRLVWLVGAIVLVDTMFYAAVAPLLPELTRELDLGKNAAGALAAAYAAGTLVGALPGGWLAARAGVKPAVLLGLGLMSAGGLAFAFGQSPVVLDAGRFVQGLGGACTWGGGFAWLAGVTEPDRRGQVLGTALGAAIFGAQLGPVVGALAIGVGREAAFSGTVALGAALAVWAWTTPARPGVGAALSTPLSALADRRLLAGMWLTLLPAAAFGVVDVLAPLRLDDLGASGLALGATFFAAAGVEAVLSPVVGRFTDRRGALLPVRGGLVVAGLGLVVLQLPQSAPLLAVVVVVASALLGILWVPPMAFLTEGAQRRGLDDGLTFGFFTLAWAAGFMLGAGAGGSLADATSDVAAYGVIVALYFGSAVVALRPRATATGGAATVSP